MATDDQAADSGPNSIKDLPEKPLQTEALPPGASTMPEASEPQLVGEIATVQTNPFEILFDGLMRPRDATLATRGGNKGIWIYDEIERDCNVFAMMQKRKLAVVGRRWSVDAASESKADQAAAEFVTDALNRFNFDAGCTHLLDAILKGYSVGEVVWGVTPQGFLPVRIRDRDARRFVFDENARPRLLTWGHLLKGQALPDFKFIVHRYGAKDGNPYGLGLGSRLFWPAYFKRQGIQFWLTYADKFGNPTVIGEYPVGAGADQKSTLENALESIANDTGISIPTGMKISLLEAARSGGAHGVYDTLLQYMDDEISIAVLGETMTTRGSRGSGLNPGGVASVQNEVRLELVQSDADLLAGTLNETLIRWIVDKNRQILGNCGYPSIWWETQEPEDLFVRAQRDQVLLALGYKPNADLVRDVYGDGYEAVQPAGAPSPPGANPGQSPTASFAAADGGTAPDTPALQAQRLNHASGAQPWIEKIRALVQSSDSLEQVRDGLMKLMPDMSLTEYTEAMAQALAAAALAGRYDVLQEVARG